MLNDKPRHVFSTILYAVRRHFSGTDRQQVANNTLWTNVLTILRCIAVRARDLTHNVNMVLLTVPNQRT